MDLEKNISIVVGGQPNLNCKTMSEKLPNKIPIFPLRNAIFFPDTNLPLNIFEDRYLRMVEKAIKGNGIIGMIQSKKVDGDLFEIGCLGKINNHKKTPDGRILINLLGLSRFKIDKELNNEEPYREFIVNYNIFGDDIKKESFVDEKLLNKLVENSKKLFEREGMILNWRELSQLKKSQQVYNLIMISPFSVSEKQKLLEIPKINSIAKTYIEITNFAFFEKSKDDTILQ
mgnify:FL=1